MPEVTNPKLLKILNAKQGASSPQASNEPQVQTIYTAPDPQQDIENARADQSLNNSTTQTGISVRGEQRDVAKTAFQNTMDLRKAYESAPEVKNYRAVVPQLMDALNTPDDASGDNALLYAYAKIMDPASVVRESETEGAASGASIFDQTVTNLKKQFGIEGGGQLAPDIRAGLRRQALARVQQYGRTYRAQRQRYAGDAQAFQIDPERVIGPDDFEPYLPQFNEWAKKQQAQGGVINPTSQDIYSQGIRSGFDVTPDKPFDREQYLKDTYGVDGEMEARISAFWSKNSGNPNLTPEAVAQWYQASGIPVPDRAGLEATIAKAKKVAPGTIWGGFDTKAAEQAYRDRLRASLNAEGFDPTSGGAYGARAIRGAEMGLTDEIQGVQGGIEALFGNQGVADGYKFARDRTREAYSQMEDQQGGLGTAVELAGGLASGLALPSGAARGVAGMARQGAIQGAVSGYGYGEGAGGSIGGALTGAGIGMAGGALLGKAGEYLTNRRLGPEVTNRLYNERILGPEYQPGDVLPQYGYRNVSNADEVQAIIDKGYMLPPEGRTGKYFTMSDRQVPTEGNATAGKPILRVRSENIPDGRAVKSQNVEIWDNGRWRLLDPATDGADVIAAADRLNSQFGTQIAPLPADVAGATTRRITGGAAQLPLAAGSIVGGAQKVSNEAQKALDAIASLTGNPTTREAAGEAALTGAQTFIKNSRNKVNALYAKAKALGGAEPVNLAEARKVLDEEIANLQGVPGGSKVLEKVQKLRADLDGEFPVQGVRQMRTEWRDEFVKDNLRGSNLERIVNRALDAADDDITSSLNAAGKGDAARAYAEAAAAHKERVQVIDQVLAPIIGNKGDAPRSVEQVIASLETATKTNGAKLGKFLSSLPPEDAASVRGTLVQELGRSNPGAQNAAGDAFSLNTFLTNWNKLSGSAKSQMFGGESRAALEDLARVAQGTKEAQRFANSSNTGSVVGGVALGGNIVAFFSAPVSSTAALLGQYGGGKLLASPSFARWLAKMPSNPKLAEKHIAALSRIAANDNVIAADVAGLQQELMGLLGQRSAASSPNAPTPPVPSGNGETAGKRGEGQ